MRILVVNKEPPYPRCVGGTEVVISEVFSRLHRRGHEVHVVCGTPEYGLPARETIQGIEIHYLRTLFPRVMRSASSRYLLSRYLFYVLSFGPIWRVARARDIDIIYDFAFPAPSFASIVGKVTGKPCVARIWEYAGRNWFEIRDPLTGAIGFLLEKLTPRLPYDLFITSSKDMQTLLVRKGGFPEHKMQFIPQGIDLSRFGPGPKTAIAVDDPVVLQVGRFTNQKGQAYLVAAIPSIVDGFPRARFVFIGDGPTFDRCVRLAQDLGVTHCVDFKGRVADRELRLWLRSATVHVIPSLQECIPLTWLESMASGVPVVLTDGPGVAELAQHGVDALVVPVRNSEALAAGVKTLLSDQQLYESIRAGGLRTVARYRWDDIVDREEAVLQRVIDKRLWTREGPNAGRR